MVERRRVERRHVVGHAARPRRCRGRQRNAGDQPADMSALHPEHAFPSRSLQSGGAPRIELNLVPHNPFVTVVTIGNAEAESRWRRPQSEPQPENRWRRLRAGCSQGQQPATGAATYGVRTSVASSDRIQSSRTRRWNNSPWCTIIETTSRDRRYPTAFVRLSGLTPQPAGRLAEDASRGRCDHSPAQPASVRSAPPSRGAGAPPRFPEPRGWPRGDASSPSVVTRARLVSFDLMMKVAAQELPLPGPMPLVLHGLCAREMTEPRATCHTPLPLRPTVADASPTATGSMPTRWHCPSSGRATWRVIRCGGGCLLPSGRPGRRASAGYWSLCLILSTSPLAFSLTS